MVETPSGSTSLRGDAGGGHEERADRNSNTLVRRSAPIRCGGGPLGGTLPRGSPPRNPATEPGVEGLPAPSRVAGSLRGWRSRPDLVPGDSRPASTSALENLHDGSSRTASGARGTGNLCASFTGNWIDPTSARRYSGALERIDRASTPSFGIRSGSTIQDGRRSCRPRPSLAVVKGEQRAESIQVMPLGACCAWSMTRRYPLTHRVASATSQHPSAEALASVADDEAARVRDPRLEERVVTNVQHSRFLAPPHP